MAHTRWNSRRCLVLLFGIGAVLAVVAGLPAVVLAADIDTYATEGTVIMRVTSKGLNKTAFEDASRDYLSEYQAGMVSRLSDYVSATSTVNVPLSSFDRTTDDSGTIWTFSLVYDATVPLFQPYPSYTWFAQFCQQTADAASGACSSNFPDGDIMRSYVAKVPVARQWLLYFDSMQLKCCDGTWQQTRQACPDCLAKNYLPIILGCVLGFVGAVALVVGTWIACRRQKRKKAVRDSHKNAGRKAPPKSLTGGFAPSQSPGPHHAQASEPRMGRGDNLHSQPPQPLPSQPVIIKIADDGQTKHGHRARKEEPDHASTPEGTTDHKKQQKSNKR